MALERTLEHRPTCKRSVDLNLADPCYRWSDFYILSATAGKDTTTKHIAATIPRLETARPYRGVYLTQGATLADMNAAIFYLVQGALACASPQNGDPR